jgi:phosphohistidine phosphatase
MVIEILRHGAAAPAAPGGSDADRELTPEGRACVVDVLSRARDAGAKPSLILSSPYIRAHQTARLAAEIFAYTGAIEQSRALEPERSPFDLWDEIRARKAESEILLAGHLPLLGDLASILLGKAVGIGAATMLRIHVSDLVPEPAATLEWVIRPGQR